MSDDFKSKKPKTHPGQAVERDLGAQKFAATHEPSARESNYRNKKLEGTRLDVGRAVSELFPNVPFKSIKKK